MNRMVPLAALVNWDYRPRWGIENLNENTEALPRITVGKFILAVVGAVGAFHLPSFLNTDIAKWIFGTIFILSIFIATLYYGINVWISYILIIAFLYPLMSVHFKEDPLAETMKNLIEGASPPPY